MNKIESLDYLDCLEEIIAELSRRERKLLETRKYTPDLAMTTVEELKKRNFVRCPGGEVVMGEERGLRCSIEGERSNETPLRKIANIPPFYICRTTVTNKEYEEFDPNHARTRTSYKDRQPVTCITYGRAVSYVLWLRQTTGMDFSLPTEPQWYLAAVPPGWKYPYQKEGKPSRILVNVFRSFPEYYPEGEEGATLEVDDPRVPPNYLGLYYPTSNVSIFTLGHFRTRGHWGASSDGVYTVVVGGNFRSCPYGARVLTRGIGDIAGVSDVVGIRLVHPDPFYLLEKKGDEKNRDY